MHNELNAEIYFSPFLWKNIRFLPFFHGNRKKSICNINF